uniref:Similar to n=1 Tax=Steinernema glaseri TaxID=37863 RepID=A0A1I7YEA1_9BILA
MGVTPRRPAPTMGPKKDVFHGTPSPSSHTLVSPHQAPRANVNVKLRSNSRPPTAVVAPSKKAMTEPPRAVTSLSRRAPATAMSASFSQSNSRENSFQRGGGLMGDLYRSQVEKATIEDIENIARRQEQELLKQLEMGVRERKSSFQNDSPSRPGTAEGHLSSSRSVDFNSRLSPQPSFDSRLSSKLPMPKARTGIPLPSSRLPTPATRLKTPLRTIASGSNGTPLSAPGSGTSPQVAPVRRKSTEMVNLAEQPLSAYEAPAPVAQSRTPLGHHHNVIGNGRRSSGQTNGTEARDWTDECF